MADPVDCTFRTDRVGNMIVAKRGEHVCNIAQMLFSKVPGSDEYDPDCGLDIASKLQQTYMEQSRDSAYENEIMRQFTAYTDIVPINIVAMYQNHSMYIYMSVKYQGQIYELDLTADKNSLSAVLRQ